MRFRRNIIYLVLVGLTLFSSYAFPQKNPRSTSRIEIGDKFMFIEYGRPSLKGRDMFSQLETNKFWRLGADKSTTVTTSANLSFNKVSIPAGTYSLWLKKLDAKNFSLVFNKKSGQWGTQHDAIDDLDGIPLSYSEGTDSVEQFTINLVKSGKGNGGDIVLLWGNVALKAPFTFK
ncbi:MAG: DUF2911 domain-containing protein [Terriglobia bacterium]